MQTSTVNFYSLTYRQLRTYLFVGVFVTGNILLPQLCHLLPQGGMHWLPIYFFTLVGAYKYGWKVGLLTAIASPILNSVLFDMPTTTALPVILLKSSLLAVSASFAATRFKKASLPLLAGVVLFYQITGTLGEWIIKGDLFLAIQDFRIGIPGMLAQIFGGWLFINFLIRK